VNTQRETRHITRVARAGDDAKVPTFCHAVQPKKVQPVQGKHCPLLLGCKY